MPLLAASPVRGVGPKTRRFWTILRLNVAQSLPSRDHEIADSVVWPRMSDTSSTLVNKSGALERLPVGTELGRYVILDLQGAGGMGVVYSAYDPKLDRRVALKLLRPSDDDAGEAGARLLREAQALAKLAHPNVVAVHDSGVLGDVVFVEMELVDGQTLGEWTRDRPWQEILGAYTQAGRALAAVHGVGLIHRDFKPSNAIVDKEGRVRVLDFGVARALHDEPDTTAPKAVPLPSPPEDEVRVSHSPAAAAPETAWGTATGTPAYMPPEQWRGTAIDARADQYAFAASLFKAFYGVLPFDAAAPAKMIDATSRGAIAPRPAGTRVPMYVHRALVRALSFAAIDRFASMNELLDALTHDPQAALRKRVVAAVLTIAVIASVVLAVRYQRASEASVCGATADKLAGAWDAEQMRKVHEALTKSGNPSAEDVWQRTKKLLDDYAAAWVQMRTQACEESRHASRKVEDAALGARLVCLDWRLRELRGLTTVLASDSQIVHGSLDAATGLVPIAECASGAMRDAMRPYEDPAVRARVDAVRTKLAEADAQRLAGRAKAAIPIALAAVEEARKTNVRAAEGLALFSLGRAQEADGQYKTAAVTLEQAAWVAEASHDDPTLASATIELVFVVGYRNADAAGGARWEKHATAALERLGSPDGLASELDAHRASLAQTRLDLNEALALAERALEHAIRAYGRNHVQVGRAEHGLANIFVALVRYDDAMIHYERDREITEKALGPGHPANAAPLVSEAIVNRKRGDVPAALALYARALAILEPALGSDHPEVALVLNNTALALIATGKLEEGRANIERSAAIRRKVYGEEHPLIASSLSTLGFIDMKEHKYVAARANYTRSIQLNEKLGGKENPALCSALLELAWLDLREKKPDQALLLAERCLAIRTKKLAPDHPDLASPLTTVAESHLALGHAALALPLLERAASLLEKARPDALGDTEWVLARALRETSGSPARARALALSAAARFEKEGASSKDSLDEVHAWMAVNERWLSSTPSN